MKTLTIRLDDDLHARVKESADQEKRSLNAQIAWLLERGLDASKPLVELHYEYQSQPTADRAEQQRILEDWHTKEPDGSPRPSMRRTKPTIGYSKEQQAKGRRS